MDKKRKKLTSEKSQTELIQQYQYQLKIKDEEIVRLKSQTKLIRKYEYQLKIKDEEIVRLKSEAEHYEEDLKRKDENIAQLNECLTKLKGEKSSDTSIKINALPDEVMFKIFSYFQHNQLGRIAQVCKKWRKLTKCPLLWKTVIINFHPSHESQNEVVRLLCEILSTNLVRLHLEFNYCKGWKESLKFDEFCMRLGTQCPSLEILIFSGACFSINIESVVELCGYYLPNLEVLKIVDSVFTDCSVKAKYSGHSKIKILDLCCDVFRSSTRLTLPKMSSLRRMRLYDARANDDLFEGDLSFLHNLQELRLSAHDIGIRTIRALQIYAPNLRHLYLCYTMVKDSDFQGIVLAQLKTLCLGCCCVTSEGLVSLVRMCHSLQDIYVDNCVAEDYAVHPFVVANPYKLQIVKGVGICEHGVDSLHVG